MENYVPIRESRLWTTITDKVNISKPYLCLCGGGPGISDSLYPVDELIKSHFNIIRFEQRGCGRSTADGQYELSTVIEDLEEIRKFYKIEEWYIGGHSWGASVSLFYALKYPKVCKGVLYITGMGIQNDNDWIEAFNKNAEALTEPEFILAEHMSMNFEVTNKGLYSHHQYIKQPTLLKAISMLSLPVLVICGEKDIRPIWPAIQLANLLPNCKLEIMEGCNHFPWEQKPKIFKEAIFKWVKEIEGEIK